LTYSPPRQKKIQVDFRGTVQPLLSVELVVLVLQGVEEDIRDHILIHIVKSHLFAIITKLQMSGSFTEVLTVVARENRKQEIPIEHQNVNK